jgi:hypothetical protein
MNDARRKEIQRAQGQSAEDVIDALERAAMCCGDAIAVCEEAMQS